MQQAARAREEDPDPKGKPARIGPSAGCVIDASVANNANNSFPVDVTRELRAPRRGKFGERLPQIRPQIRNVPRNTRNARAAGNQRCLPSANDLIVRAGEIRLEPRQIRPGENVQFQVPIHNHGPVEFRNVTVEFALPALSVRHRETLNLRPDETVTLVFEMNFSLRDFRRPLRPRITIDPDQRVVDSRPRNNRAMMQPLELAREIEALAGGSRASRNRIRLVLEPGGCAGVRFNGRRVSCDFNPDFQVQSSPDGFTILLRGDQIGIVQGTSFDRVTRIPEILSGTQVALRPGQIAAIRSGSKGTVLLRLVRVRRTASVRSRGNLPEEVDTPNRDREFDRTRGDVPGLNPGGGVIPLIMVELEWVGGQ